MVALKLPGVLARKKLESDPNLFSDCLDPIINLLLVTVTDL